MSAITPQTEVRILKCPIEEDNKNQLTFSNATAQYNYFSSLPSLDLEGFTYQRKEGIIRYPAHIDSILEYNYVMYKNEAYSDKWFYAFITKMEYINDNMTAISIKTDVFQSWQFQIVYKKCFVEREHVNDDTIGKHTIDEGLETGSFICNSADNLALGTANLICCLCSDFPPMLEQYFKKSKYNGIYSGAKAIAFATTQDASYFVQYMEAQQKGDAIVSFFMLPNDLLPANLTFYTKTLDFDPSIFGVSSEDISFAPIDETDSEASIGNFTVTMNSTLNGYTPKNNKLFTGKYNYFYISNNAGSDVEYHYEDFVSNTPSFEIIGAFSPGGSIKALPLNYLKLSDNISTDTRYCYNYGITAPKFPICSWNSDSYTAWLSENSLNLALDSVKNTVSIIGGVGALAGGIATANPTLALGGAGFIGSGSLNVLDQMKEKYIHSRVPDQAKGNINSGDVQFSCGKCCYTLYKMSVKEEYAKIIDNYFTMFGYKVDSLKIPNITGRAYWNYVKTVDCNFEGNIPQEDLNEIKSLFNIGITLWHDTTKFLDYSQNNAIVSS